MADFSIRTAKEFDVDRVAVLFDSYRQFYENPADLRLAREFISTRLQNNDSIILVAEKSDRSLAGFCQLFPSFCSVIARPVYILYDLFVSPEARQAGVGRSLLVRAKELAEQNGIARLDLSTARTNHAAQKL